MPHRTIHLFRKGLRLHDNPTLLAALESSEAVYPVYILDRKFMTSVMHLGALRWHFLLQSLEDLQKNLCQLGSCLLVLQGEYESVLRDHVQKWNITQVTLDAEMEPFYKEMEANVRRLGEELGFQVLSLVGHSLYDTKRYVIAPKSSEVSPGSFSLDLASIGEKRPSTLVLLNPDVFLLRKLDCLRWTRHCSLEKFCVSVCWK